MNVNEKHFIILTPSSKLKSLFFESLVFVDLHDSAKLTYAIMQLR